VRTTLRDTCCLLSFGGGRSRRQSESGGNEKGHPGKISSGWWRKPGAGIRAAHVGAVQAVGTTFENYLDLLEQTPAMELIGAVAPIQLANGDGHAVRGCWY